MDVLEVVAELRTSELFAEDFPRRTSPDSGRIAIERISDWRRYVDRVRTLGDARCEHAVPVLAELWSDCALVPVRNAAGHALRAIGSHEAFAALEALVEDSDHSSTFLGVSAIFDRSPSTAFDRCAPRFEPEALRRPRGVAVATAILEKFAPNSFRHLNGKEIPSWSEPGAPTWFLEDRRWMDACIQFRHHDALGPAARKVLRYADQAVVVPALEAALAANPPRVIAPSTAASGDLVARYERGEHQAVWRELRAHESIGGALRDEAEAVAHATMTRVARAADQLAERLATRDWPARSGALRIAFSAEDAEILRQIEERTNARLPPSIRVFWQVAGGIDFVWDCDSEGEPPSLGVDLPMDEMDPLEVGAPRQCTYLFEQWEDQTAGVHPEFADPYSLDLAADHLHKANISGGAPYGVELPFAGADPLFCNEEHGLHFVDYLRLCMRWAGFPRLERYADREDVNAFVAEMTRDLEVF